MPMTRGLVVRLLASSATLATLAAAQPAPTVAVAEPVAPGLRGGEPAVQQTVIDGKVVRIEETRVRGQLTKATVESRGGLPGYEIVTADGARDLSDGAASTRGAAGKRVWKLFQF